MVHPIRPRWPVRLLIALVCLAAGPRLSLARAAYAVYNGGPSHLRRYREVDTKPSLKKIDAAFWEKYQTIRKTGPSAVWVCYGVSSSSAAPE